MGPPAERLRLIPAKLIGEIVVKKKRRVYFRKLNASCIGEILKWLNIDDLYSMSRTCKVLQKLAGLQYQRNYPNNCISIEWTAENTIKSQFDSKYDLFFAACIQNVTMTSYFYERDPLPLFDYMKTNCCQKLRELSFNRINFETSVNYGAVIKAQLKNLESIVFDRCSIGNIHNHFLNYCQHLKHLRLKEKGLNVDYGRLWKFRHYAELECLTFWQDNHANNSDLFPFFAQNAHVKKVNCMHVKLIESVLQNAIDLDNFIIHCETPEEFEDISELLKLHRLKRFEVVFHFSGEFDKVPTNIKCIDALKSMPAFQGFHGLFITDRMLVTQALMNLFNLRTLSLKLVRENEPLVWKIAQNLPMLESVRIYIVKSTNRFGANLKPLTMPFIVKLTKLKKIIVNFSAESNVPLRNDIIELNIGRSHAKDACATALYLDSDIIQKAHFVIPSGGLVHLKPTSQLTRNIYLDPFLF